MDGGQLTVAQPFHDLPPYKGAVGRGQRIQRGAHLHAQPGGRFRLRGHRFAAGFAPGAAQLVQRVAAGDAVQQRAQHRVRPQPRAALPDLQKRGLHGVFGVGPAAQDARRIAQQFRLVLPHGLFQRGFIGQGAFWSFHAIPSSVVEC